MKSKVDKLLKKLNKGVQLDVDKEFLNCLIDLDDRLKIWEVEKNGKV